MTRPRIVVAGAGLIGRRHIDLISASDRCDLAGVVETSAAVSGTLAATGAPLFRSLTEALRTAHGTALGVIIATPNRFHASQALECIGAGVPVLVEKPLADTIADAEAIVSAARRSGVPVSVGHHRRHSPYAAIARDVIDAGALGRLTMVTASVLFRKPDDYFTVAPWRAEPGGGPILINLIHEIDLLRAWCGEVVQVQALGSSATRGFPVEDTAAVSLRFAGGAIASIALSDAAATSRSWELTSRENPAYPFAPATDCYLLAGTDGSLSIPTMRLETYSGERSWWRPLDSRILPVARADPLTRQLANFCDVIEGIGRPVVSGEDGLESLRVTVAAGEAARSGRTIRVRDPAAGGA